MVTQIAAVSIAALILLSGCSTVTQKEAFSSLNQLTGEQGTKNLQ
jgi:uncharacterized protein YceK